MNESKAIQVIHASDADQHLGHLKKILDTLKEEKRIASYTTIDSNAVNEDSFKELGNESMVTVLLTNNIVDVKASIEALLLDVKRQRPEVKVAEILIDNVPYEAAFIAFPTSLEPIRSSEDMDGVWQGIKHNLKKLFPKPEIDPVPIPPPPPVTPGWKKYLPYFLGILALILAVLFLLEKCDKPKPAREKPAQEESAKFTVEGVDVKAKETNMVSQNCPEKIEFGGSIQTNGAGKIIYRWIGSNGSESGPITMEVNKKGKHRVRNFVWEFGEPGKTHKSQWQRIEILKPVKLKSEFAKFDLNCVASSFASLIVEDVFFIAGRGTVAAGKVGEGTIKTGDQIYINDRGSPILCTGILKSRQVDTASKGEEVGILLRGISKSDVKKGDKLVVR